MKIISYKFACQILTVKTTLQVKGKEGRNILIGYIKNNPSRFYYGAVGAMVAKWSAHFPFFTVYNMLHERVPVPETLEKKLLRNGCIGFIASICSDTVANTFRVLKVSLKYFEPLTPKLSGFKFGTIHKLIL